MSQSAQPCDAGKSSLLAALLGEMEQRSGHMRIQGTVAYVPQQPWILTGTFRSQSLLQLLQSLLPTRHLYSLRLYNFGCAACTSAVQNSCPARHKKSLSVSSLSVKASLHTQSFVNSGASPCQCYPAMCLLATWNKMQALTTGQCAAGSTLHNVNSCWRSSSLYDVKAQLCFHLAAAGTLTSLCDVLRRLCFH